MDLRTAQSSAKEFQSDLVTIASVIGLIAGGLGLAALLFEAFKPATAAPTFPVKPGCDTCGPKN